MMFLLNLCTAGFGGDLFEVSNSICLGLYLYVFLAIWSGFNSNWSGYVGVS